MDANAKFEVTYGDSSLFNKPVKDGFVAARFGETVLTFNSIEELCGYCVGSGLAPYNVAVRKIVRIPTWTKEDQIAGRYPAVGCLVKEKNTPAYCGYECTVIGEHDGKYCLQFDDGSMRFEYLTGIEPVETPAEKAQREEDEFVDSLKSIEIHDGTVSSFFNQGARAAYRKLKGGE